MNQIQISPLVSVLICAYNAEKFISECLDSVIKQTYSNLEVLLVDDGSTDNTADILSHYFSKDSRFRIITNSHNLGLISSLNIGLKEVRGKYIARIDADDIADPHWINTLVKELEGHNEFVAVGAYLRILSLENNGSVLTSFLSHNDILKKPIDHLSICREFPFYCPMNHPGTLIRAQTIKDNNLTFNKDYLHAEDYKFWLDLSRLGVLANYPDALVNYRLHENQISSKYHLRQEESAKKIRIEAVNYYLGYLGSSHFLSIDRDLSYIDIAKIIENIDVIDTNEQKYFHRIIILLLEHFNKYTLKELLCLLNDHKLKRLLTFKLYLKIIKKYIKYILIIK